jgi:hypothetical protein
MNILWVEDFGGRADSGKNVLNQMFGSLLSFDLWDNDLLSIKSHPEDLEQFCQTHSIHRISLCRNYFDYDVFKQTHSILNSIDLVVLDIRLDNGEHVDFDLAIPKPYENKESFHNNAGFYIFSDLVHLGFPSERICFMTGEDSTFSDFKQKCADIYVPEVKCFEKRDKKGYDRLRAWLTEQESEYVKLRRGIIEGCHFISEHLTEQSLIFNHYILGKEKEKRFKLDDAQNYLKALENSLPLLVIDTNELYKLFIRLLSHEWEGADHKSIKGLAWIMKNTRNWITHNSLLFSELDAKMVAYLVIINMRMMFKLDDTVQTYEKLLLSVFSSSETALMTEYPFHQAYLNLKNLVLEERESNSYIKDAFEFNELANNLQQSRVKHNKALFTQLLYQMFWLMTSTPYISTGDSKEALEIRFTAFDYAKTPYLIELAKHIYVDSLPV